MVLEILNAPREIYKIKLHHPIIEYKGRVYSYKALGAV